MYLVRTIYVSTISDRQNSTAMQDIIKVANANNDKNDLTGLLLFNSKYFLQVLEGGRQAVSCLLGNLHRDPRHTSMLILGLEDVAQRDFAAWSMRFVPVSSVTRPIMLRHNVTHEFQPYNLSYASALGLMRDMREMVPGQA